MELFHNLLYNYQIEFTITKIRDAATIAIKNFGNLKYGKYRYANVKIQYRVHYISSH